MNLTLSSTPADGAGAANPAGALPAVQAGADATLQQPGADGALPALLAQTAQVLQFGQWLDQASLTVQLPALADADGAVSADGEAPVDAQDAPLEAPIDSAPLLGAMSVTVLPLAQAAQATLAAVAAALPGAPAAATGTEQVPLAQATDSGAALEPAQVQADTPVQVQPAAQAPVLPQATRQHDIKSFDSGAAQQMPVAASAHSAAALGAQLAAVMPQRVPNPRAEQRTEAPARADSATRLPAAQTQAPDSAPVARPQAASGATFTAAMADALNEQAAPVAERGTPAPTMVFGAATATQAAASAGDTVTLSGPPAAWRQSLQEALGERLQLAAGRNAEQAVIRLEPPRLGQVEIAIRHSAGALEVHISATHHEVLRQLQAVSENLRSDLAQRQFTEVAVSVTPARASQNANASFGGEQPGGRGRQQEGQADDATPGQALAEAHHPQSAFSLSGRA